MGGRETAMTDTRTSKERFPDPENDLFSDAMDAAASAFHSTRYGIVKNAALVGEPLDGERTVRRSLAAAFKAYVAELGPAHEPCEHQEHAAAWHRLVQSIATILDVDGNGSAEEVGNAIADKIRAQPPETRPTAWYRGVQIAGAPHDPVEHDVEMAYGDDPRDGDGWIPLYRHPAPPPGDLRADLKSYLRAIGAPPDGITKQAITAFLMWRDDRATATKCEGRE